MIVSSSETELSGSSCNVADLTTEQKQRLTQILDDYLRGLEEGEPLDVPAVLRENGDLAKVLRVYLSKLDGLHDIAAGFQAHGELEPLVSGEDSTRVESLQLGDFTIHREIGRGGMGLVYEATQNTLHRRVALKLLPLASMLDARQIARFKNESHAAAQLQHPHIVPIFSVGIERGIHYYAMQFIEGLTVEEWIEKDFDSDSDSQWRKTIRIGAEVANALHCAHECGIVHRDVKPSNLMLDEAGKVWVTDFGLARCQNDRSLTLSGDLVGTMRYMSPEQAAGRAELVDHRTDIYSLGATIYEMLVGASAYEGEDGPAVLSAIVNQPPPHVRRLRPQLPPDLDVILQKAMSKEKDERYATADDFAHDLQAVLSGRPTIAKPPTTFVLTKRWAERHRKFAAATSLMLAIGVVGLMASVIIISRKNGELRESNALADRSFKNAQEAVNRLGSGVSAQLASIPGAEHVRHSVLQDTLSYYQQFVDDASDDPRLRVELALTESRIGSLIRELESDEASLPHFRKSHRTYQKILADNPDSQSAMKGMARNLNQMGLALVDAGSTSEAEKAYGEAIGLQQSLCEGDKSWEHQTDLALTRSNLGLLYQGTHRRTQALSELSAAVDSLTAISIANPRNVLAKRGLAAALGNLSSLSVTDDPAESIDLLERALEHQLAVSKTAPSRLKASAEVAATYNALGSAHLASGDPAKAEEAFSNAIKLYRQLHGIAPTVDGYRFDLAMSLTNASTAHYRQHKYDDALVFAREAIATQSLNLNAKTPTALILSRSGVMHSNLATTLQARKDFVAAMHEMRTAIQCQKTALEIDPDTPQAHSFLMQHLSVLLQNQLQHQQWREARRTIDEYRAAAEMTPSKLVSAAAVLADFSTQSETESLREQLTESSIALLVSARDAGVNLDRALLHREPFSAFTEHPKFQRVVRQ